MKVSTTIPKLDEFFQGGKRPSGPGGQTFAIIRGVGGARQRAVEFFKLVFFQFALFFTVTKKNLNIISIICI